MAFFFCPGVTYLLYSMSAEVLLSMSHRVCSCPLSARHTASEAITWSLPRLFGYFTASYITALTYIYKSIKVTEVTEISSISVASYIIAIFLLILICVFGLGFGGFFFHPVQVIDCLHIPVWNGISYSQILWHWQSRTRKHMSLLRTSLLPCQESS